MNSPAVPEHKIPQGTLKILNIADITWEKRYREDFGNIDDLAESIREKGVLQPITVSTDMVLLAGERRIRASLKAGLEKIPALVRKVDGEIDLREIELMENVFRKGFDWAEECALVQEIDRLYKAKNLDWSGRKTAALLNKSVAGVSRQLQLARAAEHMPELAEYKTADEALKVLKKLEEGVIVDELRKRQVSNLGTPSMSKGLTTMLRIADSNYHVGDVFKGMEGLKANTSINIIECDPPYGIDLNAQKRGSDEAVSTVHSYNEIPAKEYSSFLDELTSELFRVAGQHCWLVFWYGPTWHTAVMESLQKAGWQVDDIPCIWFKRTGQTMQPNINLARTYEPFFLARKGQPAVMKPGRANVFDFAPVAGQKKYHPTERPIPLIESILETLTVTGASCFVPFLGSGATLRACYKLGVKGWGFDLNPEYKDKFMLAVEEDVKALDAGTE